MKLKVYAYNDDRLDLEEVRTIQNPTVVRLIETISRMLESWDEVMIKVDGEPASSRWFRRDEKWGSELGDFVAKLLLGESV